MSCVLSTIQLDKINVNTSAQDWNHQCPHRCSLMTYSSAEVANASDLEGSGGLRWVQFQINWGPRFFAQGEAVPQRSGHVKRLLALHLPINHTENTGAVGKNIETKKNQPLLSWNFQIYQLQTSGRTPDWRSSFPGSSPACTVYIPPWAGGPDKEGCARRPISCSHLDRVWRKSADEGGKECNEINEALICILVYIHLKLSGLRGGCRRIDFFISLSLILFTWCMNMFSLAWKHVVAVIMTSVCPPPAVLPCERSWHFHVLVLLTLLPTLKERNSATLP